MTTQTPVSDFNAWYVKTPKVLDDRDMQVYTEEFHHFYDEIGSLEAYTHARLSNTAQPFLSSE
jgi:hypothetical protein